MAQLSTDRIRNVAIISHSGAGKTTLTEALLFASGAVTRLGRVDDGNAVGDYEPEEIDRNISIVPALCHCEWQGGKVNLLDTPGYADFIADAIYSLWVAEGALLLVDAISGVEVHTEKVCATAKRMGKPMIAVVNKMDKANANFEQAVTSIEERLVDVKPIVTHLPIGEAESFTGVIDLLAGKAITGEGQGAKTEDVPADMADEVEEAREALVEEIASSDDDLMERYLEEEEITTDELRAALGAAMLSGELIPVMPSGAYSCIGATAVLDMIVGSLPSPAGREWAAKDAKDEEITITCDAAGTAAGVIFKTMSDPFVGRISMLRSVSGSLGADAVVTDSRTKGREKLSGLALMQGKETEDTAEMIAGDLGCVTKLGDALTTDALCDPKVVVSFDLPELPEPMYTASAEAASKADEDKLSIAMARYAEEDIAFTSQRSPETSEMVVIGMGGMHLQIAVQRIKRKFGAEIALGTPKIPYRETFKGSARVHGRHKKQTGGRGQFGDCWIRVEPGESGSGFEFVDEVRGGSVPRNFIPAVEKGLRDGLALGGPAGYPIVDVKVTLDDGSSHPVDSSDIAFRMAAQIGLRAAQEQAQMTILEPLVELEVVCPEESVGDVMSDLNGRRGRVLGMDPRGATTIVQAMVPLGELATYEADLRSATQGRASYSQRFSHYEELPAHLAEKMIALEQARAAEEE